MSKELNGAIRQILLARDITPQLGRIDTRLLPALRDLAAEQKKLHSFMRRRV